MMQVENVRMRMDVDDIDVMVLTETRLTKAQLRDPKWHMMQAGLGWAAADEAQTAAAAPQGDADADEDGDGRTAAGVMIVWRASY